MKKVNALFIFAALATGCSHTAGIVDEKFSAVGHEIAVHSHEANIDVGSLLLVTEHQCQSNAAERNPGSMVKCKTVKKGCAKVIEKRGADSYFVHLEHKIEFSPNMEFTLDRSGICKPLARIIF